MNWEAPKRPLDHTESTLVKAVLDDTFPIGSKLPGERKLAEMLGVTRPTLREALRRLERDGWFTVNHGKATVVNDYWKDGRMNVLSNLVQHAESVPPNFVANLLQIRADMAPSYTREAARHHPDEMTALFQQGINLPDAVDAFAEFDWHLHRTLTIASENPIYTLIMNGFTDFYENMAQLYFLSEPARRRSRAFYQTMHDLIQQQDLVKVETAVRTMMQESIDLWPGRGLT
ncbi:MAG: fatty acid metabolism transcriptional regulator FadR [Chloroflexi bacterium]|nr:MAG: fatty acid metabolism transcriptional regulator FadR [Chloroflexota bacterium]